MMIEGRHVEELLPAYALGILDAGELKAVKRHLKHCDSCRIDLAGYDQVVSTLALSLPSVEPPEALKEKIIDHLKPSRSSRSPSIMERLRGVLSVPRVAPVWAAAGVLALTFLVVLNLVLWQRVQRLETLSELLHSRIVALSATQSAPGARGVIIYKSGETSATLVVEDLPPLNLERQYQLWLIRDGKRTSGGVFSVSPQGYGSLTVSAPLPLSNYQAFGITIEPAGGSPGPTGSKVLGGQT